MSGVLIYILVNALTFRAVRNFVVHRIKCWHACGLHADMTVLPEEDRYGDETVPCGTPEILDDKVFRPFICDADL